MARYKFDGVRFAKALHSERWGRGEGVRQVAENLGTSASTISRWERATVEPPVVLFLVACGHYGLNPLDYIMEIDDSQAVLPGFEPLVQQPLVSLSNGRLPGDPEMIEVNEMWIIHPDDPRSENDGDEYLDLYEASGGYR